MNRHLILTAVLFGLRSIFFGQTCKSSIDPFTSQTINVFDWSKAGVRWLFLEKKDSVQTLEFRHVEQHSIDYTIPRGSEILLKLENGDTLKLKTFEDLHSSRQQVSSRPVYVVSSVFLRARISKEQLQKLAGSKLVYLRHPDLHGGTRDVDGKGMNSKFPANLMKGAKCLLGLK